MKHLAQLIKILDCISRYEWNVYRYPSQFIRLKQDHWNKLNRLRQEQQHDDQSIYSTLLQTEDKVKRYFLDKLFPIQMKWATSTVAEVSFLNREYYLDKKLRYLLQRFPDIYLVMYYPIFSIKKAIIDGPIIMISPIGIELITFVDRDPNQVIYASEERMWLVESLEEQDTMLNPLIELRRAEHIIKSILQANDLNFPIQKTVLSQNNNIVFHNNPYQTRLIGKLQYDKWFQEKRRLSSSLKNIQLRVAEALLKRCVTTAIRRPEWEEDEDPFSKSEIL
ncbi:NERD domain-containing protein [Ornithinibacillus sp. 4-3]|uniref:NERD domain-containing protein n=1 Tax=Ornithinibacillus sp. 4-3 TaxID=3231488 RepID=A0AB39HVY2_9BACI